MFKKVAWKTFGDKSSMKNTHGSEMQLQFDLSGKGFSTTETDNDCYFVKDIAKYIYDKYFALGTTTLADIYADLDMHPVFPSDGYKIEIRAELKRIYSVVIKKDGTVIFPSVQGV